MQGSKRPEQVAAVCFRVSSVGIEFLLVKTRRGRWIFPKGGVEPGLTRAQAAALEAFEEAGAHGRIEEAPFARYHQRKKDKIEETGTVKVLVHAFLCEVLRLGPPQEINRDRTWFSPEKAKSCLRDDRPSDNGAQLARVIDRAIARIHRLNRQGPPPTDSLQRVQFEAVAHSKSGSHVRYRGSKRATIQSSPEVEFAVNSYLGEILRLNGGRKQLSGMVQEFSSPGAGGDKRVIEITKGAGRALGPKTQIAGKKKPRNSSN